LFASHTDGPIAVRALFVILFWHAWLPASNINSHFSTISLRNIRMSNSRMFTCIFQLPFYTSIGSDIVESIELSTTL
jgi:hypothetical protein